MATDRLDLAAWCVEVHFLQRERDRLLLEAVDAERRDDHDLARDLRAEVEKQQAALRTSEEPLPDRRPT